jgi:D-ribose pyranase
MKREGILSGALLGILADAGHGDLVAITDRGFPLARHPVTDVVDISVVPDVPRVNDILGPLSRDLAVEGIIIADETLEQNPGIVTAVRQAFPGVPERTLPHAQMKEMVLNGGEGPNRMIAQVRTGEFSAYANVVLVCGVAF